MIYCHEKENSLRLIEIMKNEVLTYKEMMAVVFRQKCGTLGGGVEILEEISTTTVMVFSKIGALITIMLRYVYIKYQDDFRYGLMILPIKG